MKRSIPQIAASLVLVLTAGATSAETDRSQPAEEVPMSGSAKGSFDVKAAPLAEEPRPDGNTLGRYSLDKKYHGDLEATGVGEMLTAGTPVEGSAGYVALEHVDGTLGGRRGTFVLQHHGRMGRGEQQLDIRVLPDSGTGELEGLEGRLHVTVAEDGEHFYELEYTLGSE